MYYSNDWSVEKNLAQFQKWHDDGVATGGFVWVYNDESWDLNAWASGMNRIFGAFTVYKIKTAESSKCFRRWEIPVKSESVASSLALLLTLQVHT